MQHSLYTACLSLLQGHGARSNNTAAPSAGKPRLHGLLRFSLVRSLRRLSPAMLCFVLIHWTAAIFLAASLLHYNVVLHSGMRLVMMIAATLTGPVTCAGLMRNHHKLRHQRGQRARLMHRTCHDDLTGLPNRTAMRAHLVQLLEAAATTKKRIVCLYLDLDGLRFANTLLGYQAGDQLLEKIVERVGGCLAPTDHFSRFGGDKFVVLLQRALSRAETEALANAIIHSVARPQTLNGQQFTTGVSIGIATCDGDNDCCQDLLAEAERAMYAVKRSGRSGFNYGECAENSDDARKRMLGQKLQQALLAGDLRLEYQPIFSANGELVAAEALCRWHDAEEGHISPGEFIPVAESIGLIVPLTKWVLQTACAQMQAWRLCGSSLHRVAVNICVLQASRNDFVSTVEETLAQTGLPSCHLELEVTESALAHDFESVREHLNHLRQLGIRIAIDDFGTGYSSFGRLRDLQVDALKIDRIFVQGARDTHNGVDVLHAIVTMAHALQLTVVAEGVETADQLEMLRAIQCDELQGFLLARPQAPALFEQLLNLPAPAQAPSQNMGLAASAYPA